MLLHMILLSWMTINSTSFSMCVACWITFLKIECHKSIEKLKNYEFRQKHIEKTQFIC